MDGLRKDQQGAEKQTQGWVQRLGDGVNKFLGKALVVGAGAAAGAVTSLAGTFVAATVKAASLQGVQDTFFSLADGAKLAELRAASMNRVLDADLMTNYNNAVIGVSQSFADDLPQAMQYLGKVADATGQPVSYLLESYQLGIAKLSPMILDNLKIQVNANQAYEDFATANGLAVESLTKEQQQMALNAQVLDLLAEKTAGMADTSGNAQTKLDQLKTVAGNLFMQLGQVGIPILLAVLTPLGELAERYGPMVSAALGKAAETVEQFFWLIGTGVEPLMAIKILLGALGVPQEVIDTFWQIVEGVRAFVAQAIPFVQEHGPAIVNALLAVGAVLAGAGIVAGIGAVAGAIAALVNPITLVLAGAALLGVAWTENWGGIQEKTQAAIEFVTGIIEAGLALIQGFWEAHGATIQAVIDAMFAVIKAIFQAFKSAFEGDWRAFGENLRVAWDQAWSNLKTIVSNGVTAIKGFFTNTDWNTVGTNVVQGIASGIEAGIQWVKDAATRVAKAALDAAKGFLGIDSPSKAFAWLGEMSAEGFAGALTQNQGVVANAAAGMAGAGMRGATQTSYDQRTYISLQGNYKPQDEVSMADDVRMLALQFGL